ncbi:MAG: hypothetical protein GY863_16360, partial [bacterium]|nr:hypothetical protein [bacterium]
MQKVIEGLIEQCDSYLPENGDELLNTVLDYSREVRKQLGDDRNIFTFEQSCEMVGTLCELKMDKNAIAAGVLHDLYISDTVRKDIGRKFD